MARNWFTNYLQGMTKAELTAYLASAKQVRIGTIEQVEGNRLVVHYVAKLHGVIISPESGKYLFDTPEEAREYGKRVLAKWKAEVGQ